MNEQHTDNMLFHWFLGEYEYEENAEINYTYYPDIPGYGEVPDEPKCVLITSICTDSGVELMQLMSDEQVEGIEQDLLQHFLDG